jgi:hypothetical protein
MHAIPVQNPTSSSLVLLRVVPLLLTASRLMENSNFM